MPHQPTDVPDRSLDGDPPSRVWLTAVLRPAGTLAGAFADAIAQSIDELSTTADMVVVDLEAAQIPDAEAVVDLIRPSAARLASVGKCLLLLHLPEALVDAVQVAGVPAAALPSDVDPGWTLPRPRRPALSPR
jgi:hypothetical protein